MQNVESSRGCLLGVCKKAKLLLLTCHVMVERWWLSADANSTTGTLEASKMCQTRDRSLVLFSARTSLCNREFRITINSANDE